MEDFVLLEGTDTLKGSRELLNNNFLSVRSLSGGTAFPTDNLSVGMLCYRTDLNKLYQRQSDGSWSDKIAVSVSGSSESCIGNAATATSLQTKRTINGVYFDGTSNIEIDVGVKKINGSLPDDTGNVIIADYIKEISLAGQTLTVTFKNNSTRVFTTQDTTYSSMRPATSSTAGAEGLVPAPAAGEQALFLRGDGTWVENISSPFTVRATEIGNGTKGASNKTPAVIVATKRSGFAWYRLWSDGWLEQGGRVTSSPITFTRAFKNPEYTIGMTIDHSNTLLGDNGTLAIVSRSTTGFEWASTDDNIATGDWYACGL